MTKLKNISEHLLGDGFNVRLNTRGFSMFPLIRTGDRIIIKSVRSPALGDVIVFKKNDELVCHRLRRIFVENGTTFLQTKGDNQFKPDEPITSSEILGKVVEIDRGNVAFGRKMLLSCYPLLRFGNLNALFVSALIQIRELYAGQQ
ncbi:MAG: signal peptidase I [Nitrospirota bacterium]|nr:signal peptidase I [Nitrospirota bacterium]